MSELAQRLREELGAQGVDDVGELVAALRELRDGARMDGWPFGRPQGAFGASARFLQPTDETTLTWGDTQSFQAFAADTSATAHTTRQLVHVARHRPTTFTILFNVVFGNGWTAEPAITFTLLVDVGVGQARCQVKKTYTAANPAAGSTILDVFTVPSNAIQCQASFAGLIQPGEHDANVTILAAPVYA